MRTSASKYPFVLIAEIVAESGGTLAVEHHQLRESRRFADGFSVTGDGLFGFGNGRILIPQYVWPEPTVQRFLVGPQRVTTHTRAGVKKRPIIFVGVVEILDQVQ
jgi:hypothetical protein